MTPVCHLLATAATWLVAGTAPTATAPPAAGQEMPMLEAAPGKRAAAAAGGDAVAGARLVLSAATEARRLELAHALDALTDGWRRRRNPLFVPLADDDAGEVDKLLAAWLPATTAALALTAGGWQSSDGDLAVRPVARCAPGARCVRLTVGPARDHFERRLRFLAWPVGYAVVVRAASDGEAARVAERARGTDRPDSRVALILTGAEIHAPRSTPGSAAVIRAASRMAEAVRGRSSPAIALVASIARAGAAADGAPWLKLPAGSIVVVPRLGSLAEPAAFVAEARNRLAAAGGNVEWLTAPAPP